MHERISGLVQRQVVGLKESQIHELRHGLCCSLKVGRAERYPITLRENFAFTLGTYCTGPALAPP